MPLEWRYGIFQLTLSGEGRVKHHGQEYKVPEGYAYIAHSTDPEVSYWNPLVDGKAWHFIYLEISGTNIKAFIEEYIENFGPIFQFSQNSELVKQVQSIGERQEVQEGISTGKQQYIIGLLKECLMQSSQSNNSKGNDLVGRAVQQIHQDYCEGITVNDLAQSLAVSREFLSREFKKNMGTSPYQYIQKYRLNEAHDLLTQSSLSIKEITFRLGYSSTTIFSRQFKQFYQMTPSNLRKK